MTTFLGLPSVHSSPGVGHLQGSESFPTAARRALGDTQLRSNIGRATTTIRGKRARVVAEVPDWEELREAGRTLKAATMARLFLLPSWVWATLWMLISFAMLGATLWATRLDRRGRA